MFLVDIQKNQVKVNQTEPLTSGSSKVYLVCFNFSEEWQDLARVAVFNVGDTTINVLLDEKNVCFIPWEVLTKAGVPVRFGVYGTRDGDVVLPTIWAQTPTILQGVVTGIDGQEPTPDVYQQLLGRLEEILDKINSGDFGGGGSGSGEKGDPGATFFPTVSEDGVISWTNNGNLPNPEPVDIRGPKGEGADLVAGQGIEIADDTVSVKLPTKELTQDEYDALTDEERNADVLYLVDEPEWTTVPISIQEYDTDDGWHVRKWSDGYVEMIYRHVYNVTSWTVSDRLYAPTDTSIRKLPPISYPITLTILYEQIANSVCMNGIALGGASVSNPSEESALTGIDGAHMWAQANYPGKFMFTCKVTGRWK